MDLDIFAWWAITISGGSIFLALVSIYLYADSMVKRKEAGKKTTETLGLVRSFIFVWVLLGLLVFYIFSIKVGSAAIFAVGNVFVEAILLIYLMKNRTRKSEQIPSSRSR